MRFPFSARALALAWLTFASPAAADPDPPKGTLLLLHYRWQRDTLTLVESSRVPAAVKRSRLSAEKRAGREARQSLGPPTGFSFELLNAEGKSISTRFLPEPGTRRVEYQEKGEHALRSQVERVDSADIFLRIPETDAKTIRFYRHQPPRANSAGQGTTGVPAQGPEAAPPRTLIAEFPLP